MSSSPGRLSPHGHQSCCGTLTSPESPSLAPPVSMEATPTPGTPASKPVY